MIRRAGADTPEGRKELALLCRIYGYPVYAFVRRGAASADEAWDRTQGFFVHLLLEKNELTKVDRARGHKFRSWLLGCYKHYLANEYDRERAQKRGGGQVLESLDAGDAEGRYQARPSHDLTPERLYNRHFALSLLARVLERLRAQYVGAGNGPLFEALKGCLSGDTPVQSYEEVGAALEMSPGAVKTAASRLRKSYRELLLAEAARLVEHPADKAEVTEELRQLLEALAD
jgi:RNA polymerase sigma-70 factor (ECF subfamily)